MKEIPEDSYFDNSLMPLKRENFRDFINSLKELEKEASSIVTNKRDKE